MILATFNVGLLRRFGGLLQPTPFVEARFEALVHALRSISADIIALQELYEDSHWFRLIQRLSNEYPHSLRDKQRHWPKLSSGLGLLSRRPLSGSFVPFRKSLLDERILVQKGMLVAATMDAASRPIVVINTHTTAGAAFSHPEGSRSNAVRAQQLEQLFTVADTASGTAILLGDMNAGPGVSETNYSLFEKAGWVDVHGMAKGSGYQVTWDPENRLNKTGPHRHCPPQRIDHIFVRARDVEAGLLFVASSGIAFDQPCVDVGNGERVTVSDHYGVSAKLEFGVRVARD